MIYWPAVTGLSCNVRSPDDQRMDHLLQHGMSSLLSWPTKAGWLDLMADILQLVRLVLQPCLSSSCIACAWLWPAQLTLELCMCRMYGK